VAGNQYKTRTINKNLNPVWGESFNIDCTEASKLYITVWDKDLLSADDFLGHFLVDMGHVSLDGTPVWFTLQPRQGKRERVQGEVKLSFVPGGVQAVKRDREAMLASRMTNTFDPNIREKVALARRNDNLEIDLGGCELVKVPGDLKAYVDWLTIDMSFNTFTSFPDVFLFKDLNELFLNGNQITTLPARIGELKNLRVLYLTGNQIQEIPSEIGFLENLEKLSIANNAVKVIPPELGNLGRLEELDLSGNPLRKLPSLLHMDYLEIMDLNACQLAELPVDFGTFPRLLELNLGTNKIAELPDSFGNLTRLVTLNLSDNFLKQLPITMGRCINLVTFQIDRNPLADEELMTKLKIGTDHVVDTLEKRYFAWEQERKRKEAERELRKKQLQGAGAKPKEPVKTTVVKLTPSMPSTDIDDERLTNEEKLLRIRYAAMNMGQEVKQALITVKRELAVIKTLDDLIPVAQQIRGLISVTEEAKQYIPPYVKPKPPPPSQTDTKFDQLKKATAVCLREVEDITAMIISTLSTILPPEQLIPLAQLTRTLKDKVADKIPTKK
jgi:hypothetical protein